MKTVTLVVRILLGLMLLLFGVSGLFSLIDTPTYPEEAQAFMDALVDTGYMFVLINLVKTLVGISLLTNRYILLALIVFVPVALNMLLFHVFLALDGSIVPSIFMYISTIFLLVANRRHLQSLFVSKH